MRIRHFDKRGVENALHWHREEMKKLIDGRGTNYPGASDKLDYAYNDILVSPAAMRVPASGAPSTATWKTNLKAFQFANTGGEYLHIDGMQTPHSYVPGTDLHFHVHFVPTSSITDGQTVVWTFEYTAASVWDAFPAEGTVTCTFTNTAERRAELNPAAVSGTSILADAHLIAGGGTISGDGLGLSAIVFGRLSRSASDTFGGAVNLLSADAHIQIDRIGSREQYRG